MAVVPKDRNLYFWIRVLASTRGGGGLGILAGTTSRVQPIPEVGAGYDKAANIALRTRV